MSDKIQVDLSLLAEPFQTTQVHWKPQAVKGNRCLAVAYIDARLVMDRLDEVVGPGGWKDEYQQLDGGAILCRLSVKVDGEWVSKEDVGGQSEQPDDGDRRKAAFSDALKRAAVKWGVGRYLYDLPLSWVDYDEKTRRIVNPPRLPDWALPRGDADDSPRVRNSERASPPAPAPARSAPKDGKELCDRLVGHQDRMVKAGVAKPGELFKAVRDAGKHHGWPESLLDWNDPEQIEVAVDTATAFMKERR